MHDDYPQAATKHFLDGDLLLREGRYDNAVYLFGYVAECKLKHVINGENHSRRIEEGNLPALCSRIEMDRTLTRYNAEVVCLRNAVNQFSTLHWFHGIRYWPRESFKQVHAEDAKSAAQTIRDKCNSILAKMRADRVIK